MGFTTTGNNYNHWTKKEAQRVLKEEGIFTQEELKDLTGRELISLASGTMYSKRVMELESKRFNKLNLK